MLPRPLAVWTSSICAWIQLTQSSVEPNFFDCSRAFVSAICLLRARALLSSLTLVSRLRISSSRAVACTSPFQPIWARPLQCTWELWQLWCLRCEMQRTGWNASWKNWRTFYQFIWNFVLGHSPRIQYVAAPRFVVPTTPVVASDPVAWRSMAIPFCSGVMQTPKNHLFNPTMLSMKNGRPGGNIDDHRLTTGVMTGLMITNSRWMIHKFRPHWHSVFRPRPVSPFLIRSTS